MSDCKACRVSLEDITHYLWSFLRAQEVWMRSLRILTRCGVEVRVSSAVVVWLATESVALFHGWNGNNPSLKVMNGTIQPAAQGDSFYIQERYVNVWFLMVGLTVGKCGYLGARRCLLGREPHRLTV